MTHANPPLPTGYSPVPPGHVANVATFLEMPAPPAPHPPLLYAPELVLKPWRNPDLATYRALFKTIGETWLWYSRLMMADAKLSAILGNPDIALYRLFRGKTVAGLLELDFTTTADECELSFFGLVPEEIGKGAGRFLMTQAIGLAWAKPIKRFWVHTCSFDHPTALDFYRRSGFTPYQVAIEIHEDPRLSGHLPRSAAPQIPVIE